MSKADAHWPQLDGLRGVAILLVMLYHFLDLLVPSYKPAAGAARWMWALGGSGWVGVDLFFVLSGFLITGILYDSRGRDGYFSSFYMRRVLRIFPLYYGILLFLLVVMPLVHMPASEQYRVLQQRQGWYWTYMTNWLIACQGDFGAVPGGFFWSLAVEEQFYFVWPFLIGWLSRVSLLRLCFALVLLGPMVRLSLLALGCSPSALYVMTFTHLEPLAVGAGIALALRASKGEIRSPRWFAVLAWTSLFALAVVFVWRGQLKFWDAKVAGIGTTLLALAFGGWLFHVRAAPAADPVRRFCQLAPLRSCGRLSYALYLFHLPAAFAVRKWVFDPLPSLQNGGFTTPLLSYLALAAAVSWFAAWVSWHLFEKHFLRLKRFFVAADKTADAPVVSAAA